jgi:hypothetical protein
MFSLCLLYIIPKEGTMRNAARRTASHFVIEVGALFSGQRFGFHTNAGSVSDSILIWFALKRNAAHFTEPLSQGNMKNTSKKSIRKLGRQR